MQAKKKFSAQAVWLAVFIVGYVLLYMKGAAGYAAENYTRPYWQNNFDYTVFCTLPFHFSKGLGTGFVPVRYNVWTLMCAAFYFVCGLGLYLPSRGDRAEHASRYTHFLSVILPTSFFCSAIAGSSLYNGMPILMLFKWGGLWIMAAVFVQQIKSSPNKLWTVCIYVSGICFTLAVAGFTRAIWVLGLSDKVMLPLLLAKLGELISGIGKGGIPFMLITYLLQTAMVMLIIAMGLILCRQQKYSRNINEQQFWCTVGGFAAMYIIRMRFFQLASTPLALKYWVATVLAAILLGMMAPKGSKRLLRTVCIVGIAAVSYGLVCSFSQFYDAFYAAFTGPLDTVYKVRDAFFRLFDAEMADRIMHGNGTGVGFQFVFGIAAVLLTVIILAVARALIGRINSKDTSCKCPPERRSFGLMMLWCGCILVGLGVRCLDFPYRFVGIIAYVVFSAGVIGLLVTFIVCLRLKDKLAMQVFGVVAGAMVLLVPLYACFAKELGVLVLVILATIYMQGFLTAFGSAGSSSQEDEPGELSAVEQFSMAIAMDSALSAIDAGVASGAISSTAGASAAQDIIGAAASRGFFGKG